MLPFVYWCVRYSDDRHYWALHDRDIIIFIGYWVPSQTTVWKAYREDMGFRYYFGVIFLIYTCIADNDYT